MKNKNLPILTIQTKNFEENATRVVKNWNEYRVVKPEEIKTNIAVEPAKAEKFSKVSVALSATSNFR